MNTNKEKEKARPIAKHANFMRKSIGNEETKL
jgi:hypothetical protein